MKTINGQLYKEMIIGGRKFLDNQKEIVDAMNVFPVPDGDTGTNMSLTMKSVYKEVTSLESDELCKIADAMSRGALKGARGNSGVILSQIFKGFNDEIINSKQDINSKILAKALTGAARKAYAAVNKPKEGTILTVIRLVAKYAESAAHKFSNVEDFFEKIIEKGNEVLKQTPEMLPILKKANTVDAGGKGLLCVFNGFLCVLKGIEIEESNDLEKIDNELDNQFDEDIHDLENIEFAYCTEFFIINLNERRTEADIDKFRDSLTKLGDCVLVIGDLELVKVHVHTNNPGKALQLALKLGELDGLKIENMRKQAREIKSKREAEKMPQAIISICAGKGISDIFKDLGVANIIEGGQTMNPSVDDILNAINRVNSDVVFVLPNNKNIIFAANQAKELTDKKCFVIPSINVPQGITACLSFDIDSKPEDNDENMLDSLQYVTSGQVSHAVRDVNIDGLDVTKGDFIGLNDKKILVAEKSVDESAIKLIDMLNEERGGDTDQITLYYGADIDIKQAEDLATKLQEHHPDCEILTFYGGQPHYYYLISLE